MISSPDAPADSGAGSEPTPTWKLFGVPALLVLVGYILFYACDARLRERRGPWSVTFRQDADGAPALSIDQPGLGIRNVVVRFPGESVASTNRGPSDASTSALPALVRFDAPGRPVPFGRLAFDDLMYLPGTVVLQCFGHEVQLLPRTLYLNRSAHGWTNDSVLDLLPSEKPAPEVLAPPPKRRPLQGKSN